MTGEPFGFETITELADAFARRAASPVDYTARLLERIQALDPALTAFVRLTRERALAEAAAAEAAIRRGDRPGPLAGVPYAAKDIFDVAGEATMAGSRLFAGNTAADDCAVVRRLKAAGMVLVGKTHTAQLASTIIGINHDQGTPHNPWRREPHVPGGSSSGSAVAVAAGLVPMALASDTGGSVRTPASLCGVVGLKTTVGRVSRAGVVPLAATYDSVGPLTRSVADAALVYQAISGPDPGDETTWQVERHQVLGELERGVAGLRLAFADGVAFAGAEPEVEAAVRASGEVFRALGARIDSRAIPEFDAVQDMADRFVVLNVEAYAANRDLLDRQADALDPVVLWMTDGRAHAASAYVAVLARQRDLRHRLAATLGDVDAVLVPATPIPARPVDLVDADHRAFAGRYVRNTFLGNFLGLCAVALPCGFTAEGLPIGLMVYAKPFHEEMALRVALAYERATDWHRRHPDLGWAG